MAGRIRTRNRPRGIITLVVGKAVDPRPGYKDAMAITWAVVFCAVMPSKVPWGEPLSYVVMAVPACVLPVLVVWGVSRKTPRNARRHIKAKRARMQRT